MFPSKNSLGCDTSLIEQYDHNQVWSGRKCDISTRLSFSVIERRRSWDPSRYFFRAEMIPLLLRVRGSTLALSLSRLPRSLSCSLSSILFSWELVFFLSFHTFWNMLARNARKEENREREDNRSRTDRAWSLRAGTNIRTCKQYDCLGINLMHIQNSPPWLLEHISY